MDLKHVKDFGLLVVVVFALGVSVYFVRVVLGDGTRPAFHEIAWDSRAIATKMVEQIAHDTTLATVPTTPVQLLKDTAKQPATGTPGVDPRQKAVAVLQQKIAGLNDSMWENFAATRLFADPERINAKLMTTAGLNNVRIVYMDTAFPLRNYSFTTSLPVTEYPYLEEFISKYPIFGAWMLFIIFQMVAYSLIIPWLGVKLFGKVDECAEGFQPEWYVKLIYPVAVLVVCFVLYRLIFLDGVNHEALSKDQYFMYGLTGVFRWANGLGYVVAGMCIAGMLFTMLEIGKLPAGAPSADVVKYLDGRLKLYFTIVAIVLSLGVFTTGTLFSALNSLDFVSELTKARGYTMFPSDYVVLYGLIHSFALMLFSVPAKYTVDNVKSRMVPAPEPEDWSQLKKLGGLAVAGSPLLAGLFQSLLDMVAK